MTIISFTFKRYIHNMPIKIFLEGAGTKGASAEEDGSLG